jgi:phosphoribosylformimino-5-aminoimidazole carboxamide ribotide isomerase
MRLIPSIDLRGGRCVRLLRGDFAAETQYDYEPHELLTRYRTLGATWLHIVDLDGARDGVLAGPNLGLYAEAQRRFPQIRWQASGGVRDAADLAALAQLGVSAAISGKALLEKRIEPTELQPYFPAA